MIENKIDSICCLQDIELKPDYNHLLLSTRNYLLRAEKNEYKSRAGIFIDRLNKPPLDMLSNFMLAIN